MSSSSFPQLRSLSAQIADHMAEDILRGKYYPGQVIVEQEIADKFSVSRSPVREAFLLLEKEGVLVITPRRKVHVALLTLDEVAEIFAIRGVLFGLAARLCAERSAELDWKAIEGAYAPIKAFLPGGEAMAEYYSETAADTTRVIVGQCGNQRLIIMLNRLGKQIQRYSLLGLTSTERQLQSKNSFKILVEAIRESRQSDAETAARSMANNTGRYAARMLKKSESVDVPSNSRSAI